MGPATRLENYSRRLETGLLSIEEAVGAVLDELAEVQDMAELWRGSPEFLRREVNALAQLRDGSIRELALRLLCDDPAAVARGAVRLFERNYAPGDHAVIEAALFVSEDHEATHWIGFDVLEVAESQPDPRLSGCLSWVYEHTPCSNCRGKALKELLRREHAPVEILEEAAWDGDEDTRALAREALNRID